MFQGLVLPLLIPCRRNNVEPENVVGDFMNSEAYTEAVYRPTCLPIIQAQKKHDRLK